ncbi:MAG TPA: Rrf2 family transcriptional regulator [Anaerolineaceae bacterium]|jgi:Rrf2 family protein|nr:Rrf2 family transcriptional regulator [Chloroflexota bacterium]HNS06939.1 Rrf2 family transcriptional regulator [Anaerolineaceae bacterium]HNW13648.1 Rrf2 family transcriptional regulator [Anaerolineaceae bacterium]HOE02201.1 Rrf2 family transcriptional regulator [Anaerolineaceae bacterium]HOQ69589.1 Rrf2 family transcriptional regulator [Anaerolineaceae bacterium]
MKITRQADYALRAMVYLSQKSDSPTSTKEIAKAQGIPPSFLAKIISQLSLKKLIIASRGANGGVALARPASNISLLEVIEAIDGEIALNQCTVSIGNCDRAEDCPLHIIWQETQDELVTKLRNTTFDRFSKKN